MAYLLDANVFIEAKNRYYGFDFCPAFWDWMIAKNAEGQIFIIEKVGDEIEAGGDDLADWVRERGDGFFIKPAPSVLAALGKVDDWAAAQAYDPVAVATFMEGADCYLVSHALDGGHEVVTLETRPAQESGSRFPMPASPSGSNA